MSIRSSNTAATSRLVFAVVIGLSLLSLTDSRADVMASHGIAMHGAPALPQGFTALPQVNPDAPKGGRITMGEVGGFDSLNPFSTLGRPPAWLAPLTVETLLARAWDEPFTLYAWVAETVITDESRTFVEFNLDAKARFADGTPITPADVLWSFDALATAHPKYLSAHKKVRAAYATGPHSIRFDFHESDRELPLILGLRPILKRADWEDRDLKSTHMQAPVGSGPYQVASIDPGRSITFKKRPDWWAKDLPVMRGQHNFDEIRIEYFADSSVMFEAFKAGELSVFREGQSSRWQTGYDFQRLTLGEVVKSEIPHHRPAMMTGLAFNTRRPIFSDWRVRQALIDSFNFEFINATLNAGTEPRVASWFHNSTLAMGRGAASAPVRALLQPFADQLPPDAFEDLSLPISEGGEANRPALRRATALLASAGWQIRDGRLQDANGTPFRFELLLLIGAADMRAAATIWTRALERLGIEMRITQVDDAQMTARLKDYDFDMTPLLRANSLSPGNEQLLYWGRNGVTQTGTRNIAGADDPAIEAMITRLVNARDPQDFTHAVQALDRVLMAGRYVIPLWFSDRSRLAHDANVTYPADSLPVYGDASGFLPEIWYQRAP